MTAREERLQVIDNIKKAIEEKNSYKKVELFDPVITDDDVKRIIEPFDTQRRKLKNKILAFLARKIAEKETEKINTLTEIRGLENALSVNGGAIITQNHFNIIDNTFARLLAMECQKGRDFHIVIQETNVFMKGYFGFLMKNCNTLPVSRSASYMAKNLKPAIKNILKNDGFILIYPEQEMWFNYKKPRELRDGAYHYAAEFGAPIIPTFVTMENAEEIGEDGFYKQKHVLNVMRPIYPDKELSVRENRERMKKLDAKAKRSCYEEFYGVKFDENFVIERDIAGYKT